MIYQQKPKHQEGNRTGRGASFCGRRISYGAANSFKVR